MNEESNEEGNHGIIPVLWRHLRFLVSRINRVREEVSEKVGFVMVAGVGKEKQEYANGKKIKRKTNQIR